MRNISSLAMFFFVFFVFSIVMFGCQVSNRSLVELDARSSVGLQILKIDRSIHLSLSIDLSMDGFMDV